MDSVAGNCRRVCELCIGDPIETLSMVDFIILAVVLAFFVGVGVFYFIRERLAARSTVSDGIPEIDGDNGVYSVTVSLIANYASLLLVVGLPTEMYNNNTSFLIVGLAMVPAVVTVNHVFLPFFHKLQLTSAYEYIEKRFDSSATRICASITFLIYMLLYLGLIVYVSALTLNQVTGLSLELSILAIGIGAVIHTILGGFRTLVWTESFQTLVITAGLVTVVVLVTMDTGGLYNVWHIAYTGGRISFLDWSGDPTTRHSIWALVIGSYVCQLTIYATNQMILQRYLAIQNPRDSQKAFYISLPITVILSTLICFVGLIIYVTYHSCDPLLLGHVHVRDQLLPFLVLDKLTYLPGVTGLFLAALLVALLGAMSSGLNAVATVTMEDMIKAAWNRIGYKPTVTMVTCLVNAIECLGGAAAVGVAFAFRFLRQTVLQMTFSIFGMVGGPLLGIFLAGIFFPFINSYGAFSGLIVSVVLTSWVGVGSAILLPSPPVLNVDTGMCANFNRTCPGDSNLNASMLNLTSTINPPVTDDYNFDDLWIYHLSYLWYALFAVVTSLAISILVSIVTSFIAGFTTPDQINARLIHTAVDRVCCYLPVTCHKVYRLKSDVQDDNQLYANEHGTDDIVSETGFTSLSEARLEHSHSPERTIQNKELTPNGDMSTSLPNVDLVEDTHL